MHGSRLTTGRAALVFAIATLAFTWPQIRHLTWVPDNVDSFFSMWRLTWFAHQLRAHPSALFDGNIFFPHTGTLAYSDAVLLESALAAPLLWLHIPAPLVYNALILASFPLCGVSMFLLVRELTANSGAACFAGLVFAFAPFRFDHYYHLELLWAMWMPIALLMLHRTIRTGRTRDGLVTGLIVALQGFSSIYYVVFLAIAMIVATAVLLVRRPLPDCRRALVALGAGALLTGVLLMPYALQYVHARGEVGERELGTALLYGAGPKHYFATMPGSLLYGRVLGAIGRPEKVLFFGFTTLALAAYGLIRRWSRVTLVYLAVLLTAIDGSLGLRGVVFGWLWRHATILRGLRVPGRFGEVALLAVAVLAGLGMDALSKHIQRKRLHRWLVPALSVLVCVEFAQRPLALVPAATEPAAVYRWLAAQPPGAVAEFPMPKWPAQLTLDDAKFEYQSSFHWHPLVNGYSGNLPDSYFDLLKAEDRFPSASAIAALRTAGVIYVVVHQRDYPAGTYDAAIAALNARPDLTSCGTFDDGGGLDAAAYRMRESR